MISLKIVDDTLEDLQMWKQQTAQGTSDSNPLQASKSYYIRKYKAFKERQRKLDEEERRQKTMVKRHLQENRCADVMTCIAFNRVYPFDDIVESPVFSSEFSVICRSPQDELVAQ
jgi:hypothetical protein